MKEHIFYILRQQTQDLLVKFVEALNEPDLNPILFHIWGVSGCGKTSLLNHMEVTYEQQACFIVFPFGCRQTIDTALYVMFEICMELNKQLTLSSPKQQKDFNKKKQFFIALSEISTNIASVENSTIKW